MTPEGLPDELLTGSVRPIAKLLWVWLRPYGWVRFSHRAMAQALGISQPSVTRAAALLRELELIEDHGEAEERVRATFRAVDPRGG